MYVGLIGDKPVVFHAVVHLPHPRVKIFKMSHRLVVIPDYQGLGIGWKFQEYIAQLILDEGCRYVATTSNKALVHHRLKSEKWALKRKGRTSGYNLKSTTVSHYKSTSRGRETTAWEYLGEKSHE